MSLRPSTLGRLRPAHAMGSLLAVLVLAAGCASGPITAGTTDLPRADTTASGSLTPSGSASESATASDSATPSGSPTGSPTTSDAPTATPGSSTDTATPAGTRQCADADLALVVRDVPGASGVTYAQIVFVSTAAAPCTISGYPSVRLLGADSAPVGSVAAETNDPAQTLTIAAGDAASTLLQVLTSSCNAVNAAYVQVVAPGGTHVRKATTSVPVCPMHIRPLTAGDQPMP